MAENPIHVLFELWRKGIATLEQVLARANELPPVDLVEVLSADQDERWKKGERISVEDYLERYPASLSDADAICELVGCEFRLRVDLGDAPRFEEYLERFPKFAEKLRQKQQFEQWHTLLPAFGTLSTAVVSESDTADEARARSRVPDIPDYNLLKVIGAGTFGEVWLARNRVDHGLSAIKLVPKRYKTELVGVRLYTQYARDHPHLVPIKHSGEIGEFHYYVMALADDCSDRGPSDLSETYEPLTLKRHLEARGALPVSEVLTVAHQLLSALDHLHQKGVSHCDVKPANVLRVQGTWRLGDMGLVTRSEDIRPDRGTVAFWPPEGPRDHTTDLCALGKTLYLLMTGAGLDRFQEFAEGVPRTANKDRRAEPLRQIILRACQAEPSRRFGTAEEMQRAVAKLHSGTKRRRGRVMTIGTWLIAMSLIGGGIAWALLWMERSRTQAQEFELNALRERYSNVRSKSDWEEALRIAEKIERLLTNHHPDRLEDMAWNRSDIAMARFLVNLEPEELRVKAQNEISRTFNQDVHRLVVLGEFDKAVQLQEAQVQTLGRILGDNAPLHVELARLYLGALYQEKARKEQDPTESQRLLEEAEGLYRRAAPIIEQEFWPTHSMTLIAWHNLGTCLTTQGSLHGDLNKFADAEAILRRVLRLRLETLKHHDNTVSSFLALANNLATQPLSPVSKERLAEARRLLDDGASMLAGIDASQESERGILEGLRVACGKVRDKLEDAQRRLEADKSESTKPD